MSGLTGDKVKQGRFDSIDLLRGLVMVIMALDHTRDFFSNTVPAGIDPVNLDQTNPALFLTRWITHYCAPTFIFLAGTAAFLYGTRVQTRRQLSWFLFTRGLWLAFLEITLIQRGSWAFNLDIRESGAGVMWAIGWAMVLMSGLVYLPTSFVATIGIAIVAFHNLFDTKTAQEMHLPDWLWSILHNADQFYVQTGVSVSKVAEPLESANKFQSGYCVLPWLGVMAAGYGLGGMFLLDQQTRRRQLFGLGFALTLLFVGLRFSNVYGDQVPQAANNPPGTNLHSIPGPWSQHRDTPLKENMEKYKTLHQNTWQGVEPTGVDGWWFTVFSFVNCQKYPPSLLFILMTLGPAIIALACFEGLTGPIARFFIVFGRVPMFYYLLHLPLIHALSAILDQQLHGRTELWHNGGINPKPGDPSFGVDLPMVYLVWAAVVLSLYPLCYWYAGFKRRHKWVWLSYL